MNTGGVPVPLPLRPISVSLRLSRADCLRPMRRRLSIPHAVIRSRCFSLPSPPVRYDRRSGVCGASRCLPDGAEDVAGMRSRRGYHVFVPLLALCVPLIARCRAALSYRRRSLVPFPHCAFVRPFPSCLRYSIAPPIDTKNGEPGGASALLGGADRMMCVGLKKAGGCSFPVRLLRLYRLYKPWL